jgi:hypothetical protein
MGLYNYSLKISLSLAYAFLLHKLEADLQAGPASPWPPAPAEKPNRYELVRRLADCTEVNLVFFYLSL